MSAYYTTVTYDPSGVCHHVLRVIMLDVRACDACLSLFQSDHMTWILASDWSREMSNDPHWSRTFGASLCQCHEHTDNESMASKLRTSSLPS